MSVKTSLYASGVHRYLPYLGGVGWYAILPAGFPGVEEGGQGNVVLSHHPVEHVLVTVGMLDGQLVELNQLLLHQDKLDRGENNSIFSSDNEKIFPGKGIILQDPDSGSIKNHESIIITLHNN